MKNLVGVLISLSLLTQAACGSKHESAGVAGIMDKAAAPAYLTTEAEPPADHVEQTPTADALNDGSADAPPPPVPSATPARPVAAARLLIYHAEVRLKTEAMARATTQLDSLVRRSDGYLSAAAETRADGEWRQETTIRVPASRFQALLSGLAGLGTIEEKKLTTDDVTAEHADVTARLQTKRAVERQYTSLLGKAQKIKDILDIEEKLGEVREEIEATESRLKTLNSEVAYSTIALTLYQPLPQSVPDAPVVSLGSRTVEAFYGGWQLLTSFFIGAINLWPFILLGAGGWWLWQRRRAQQKRPSQPPAVSKSV
jgi:hypothetical protein